MLGPQQYSLVYLFGHYDRMDSIFFGQFQKIRSVTEQMYPRPK